MSCFCFRGHFQVKFACLIRSEIYSFMNLLIKLILVVVLTFFKWILPKLKREIHLILIDRYKKGSTFPAIIRLGEDVLKTSSRRLQCNIFLSSKTSWRRLANTSWRRLEDILGRRIANMSWRHRNVCWVLSNNKSRSNKKEEEQHKTKNMNKK